MRTCSFFAFLVAFFFASFNLAMAQSAPTLLAANTLPQASTKASTVELTGRVESAAGPVVGAVVGVTGKTYQKAVTDGAGEFHLTVPATTRTVSLTASYAGFRDVSATVQPGTTLAPLRLTEVQAIKVARKQQLKYQLKRARKDVRRELRRLHRTA